MNITRIAPALFSTPINNNPQKKHPVSFGKILDNRQMQEMAFESLGKFIDQFKKSKVGQELFKGNLAGAENIWARELIDVYPHQAQDTAVKKRTFFDFLQKLETPKKIQEFLDGSSKELRQAVEEHNYNKALTAFEKQNASSFITSKTAGATIQDSIKNSLGALADGIIPHNYDLTKELNEIAITLDGVEHITLKANNTIFGDVNKTAKLQNIAEAKYTECLDNKFFHKQCLHEGEFGIPAKKVIRMELTNMPMPRPSIILVSPNANLTPAQKDLIMTGKTMYSYVPQEPQIEQTHEILVKLLSKKEDLNYDSILSVIQTLGNRAFF